jgi:hypothetical protein
MTVTSITARNLRKKFIGQFSIFFYSRNVGKSNKKISDGGLIVCCFRTVAPSESNPCGV